jgi:hypothetical protein
LRDDAQARSTASLDAGGGEQRGGPALMNEPTHDRPPRGLLARKGARGADVGLKPGHPAREHLPGT